MKIKRTASAAKRGRNPRFPFVPIVAVTMEDGPKLLPRHRTHNINAAKAFATREEAIAHAQAWIDKMESLERLAGIERVDGWRKIDPADLDG
jgi:hypothetical protein